MYVYCRLSVTSQPISLKKKTEIATLLVNVEKVETFLILCDICFQVCCIYMVSERIFRNYKSKDMSQTILLEIFTKLCKDRPSSCMYWARYIYMIIDGILQKKDRFRETALGIFFWVFFYSWKMNIATTWIVIVLPHVLQYHMLP